MSRRTWLKVAASAFLVAGAAGAVSALGSVAWDAVATSFRTFDPGWIALAATVSTIQVFGQLLRAWVAFPVREKPESGLFGRVTATGQLLNAVTPLRSGDAYKVIRLSATGVPAPATLAGLFGERVADNFALVTLAAWASAKALNEFARLAAASVPAGAVAASALATALAGWRVYRRGVPRWLRPVIEATKGFFSRIYVFVFSRRFFVCFGIATMTWFLDAGTLWCSARSGGASLTLAQCMASVFVLNLGLAIPLTVANVGVFEAALGFALVQVGLPVTLALGIALVEHVMKIAGLVFCLGTLELGHHLRSVGLKNLGPSTR